MPLCQETLFSLLCSTKPCYRVDTPVQSTLTANNKPALLVEKACHYILLHLDHPLTLSSISKAMHTNRNSLSKAFRQELNMGVSSWLRQQRMEKAKQLLVNTTLSIQEISLRLGYPLQANFSTSFKHLFKQSPIQLRRGSHDT
ncbi:AraC family transcriptional regulator [Rheinheimera baltica]|uniref:AraC family transcriptional regulator n=1 Tax=Rheinheimera baltica TaxID=67576 RepID=A0ABT9HV52_9GAMM|nr:AraC family transcriptional regulator [Rheinheimera baltica]MDP5135009.1 AraC family transcriptional regulator [Rheinheimera baltica]